MADVFIRVRLTQEQHDAYVLAACAVCTPHWPAEIPDPEWKGESPDVAPMVPNPTSAAQFAYNELGKFTQRIIGSHQSKMASETARVAKVAEVAAATASISADKVDAQAIPL